MAAASIYSVQTGSVALSASATKSLWLLDPVSNGFSIVEFNVTFDAATPSAAVRVDLYQVSSVGSAAGSTGTVIKWTDVNIGAATTTALTALTTEPTTVAVIASWFVQPCGGCIPSPQYPLGREVGAGAGLATTNRLGLRCVTPAGVTPNACAYVAWAE